MNLRDEMRTIFSKTDERVLMSDINPAVCPSRYRVLKEMADAGEIVLFHGDKVRKLWEFQRTPGLVVPVEHTNQPKTGLWNVW